MEAVVVALIFFLVLAAYVYISARVGLAEDVHWARQQALTGHGVSLGLLHGQPATGRSDRS
jgi:hypothetical protein